MVLKSQTKLKSRHTLESCKVHMSRASSWKTRKTNQNKKKEMEDWKARQSHKHPELKVLLWWDQAPSEPPKSGSSLGVPLISSSFLSFSASPLFASLSLSVQSADTYSSGIWVKSSDPGLFSTVKPGEKMSGATGAPDTWWAFNKQSQLLSVHQKWSFMKTHWIIASQSRGRDYSQRKGMACPGQNLQGKPTIWFRIQRSSLFYAQHRNAWNLFTNETLTCILREITLPRIWRWV